jgi:23S rRNA (cytosine1962-C5)-methyltransferase
VHLPEIQISQRAVQRILSGHPWIYRSDVQASGDAPGGALVRLVDRKKRYCGQALYSNESQIALRLLTREERVFDRAFLTERILHAAAWRTRLANGAQACRLVYSEADLLPSLIIDRYGDAFVIQTLSQGMDRLMPDVVEILKEHFEPRAVVERNDVPVRSLEGLPERRGWLAGEEVREVAVEEESGLRFAYDLMEGQKTGGFLDQRENRAAALPYAAGRALDCFCYTGAFALTLVLRCESATAVDSSAQALAWARRNQELNAGRAATQNVEWREANCFEFLKAADHDKLRFETIVLDPPAFARHKSSRDSALSAYKELNLRALKILSPGGFLITCSCSFHISEADLLEILAAAALDAHRTVSIVERRTQSRDHPILLTVPETHYLKCLFLRVM